MPLFGFFIRFLNLIFIFFCCSCATIRGTSQKLKVASNPPGAQVYFKDKWVGETPSFIEIDRAKEGVLRFRLADGKEIVQPLTSSYGWGESFFANFIWAFWGAPAGWFIDLGTGAAWEYRRSLLVQFDKTGPSSPRLLKKGIQKPRIIAIAPPQFNKEHVSDEVGIQLEGVLQEKYPRDRVMSFENTLTRFHSYSYNYSDLVKEDYRDRLYFELEVSHLLETQIEMKEDDYVVQAKLVDIYTDQIVESFSYTIPAQNLKSVQNRTFWKKLASITSIIPNTFYLDYTSASLSVHDPGGTTYVPESETKGPATRLLTSFALRNNRSPKFNQLKGVFRLIPDFGFSFERYHFDREIGVNPLADKSFSWFMFTGGFGAEFGLESSAGYFYFDLIPSLAFSRITGASISTTQVSPEGILEVGYSTFLSNRLNLRVFFRQITGSINQWNSTLSQAAGETVELNSVIQSIYGIAIGFYFPESKTLLKKAFN
jgi:hypothetical protein